MALILAIEDEPISQKILLAVIAQTGHLPLLASSGEEGLEILRQGPLPDLLLLDLEMPGMGGMKLLESLNLGQGIYFPVIIFSAKNQKDIIARSLELGASDYIIKPFSAKKLVTRIDDLIFEKNEGKIRELISNLRFQDPSMARSPGLQAFAERGFDLYPTRDGEKTICIAIPEGKSPKIFAALPMYQIESNVFFFRRCSFGWRVVWPRTLPSLAA